MFCEIHGELLGFGGICASCEHNTLPEFKTKEICIKCKISNFVIDDENISCANCKEDFYIKENTENILLPTYTTVYELYKRNSFQLPIWAQERRSKEIIYLLEVREKEERKTNQLISNGILVARFDRKGKKKPIITIDKKGSYRPIISEPGEFTKYNTESHIGFLSSVDQKNWREIESSIKPPVDFDNIDQVIQDEIELFMTKFSNYKPRKDITEPQKAFLMRLGASASEIENIDATNVSREIEKHKEKNRKEKMERKRNNYKK